MPALPLAPDEYRHTLTIRKDGRFRLEVTGLYADQVRQALFVLLGPHVEEFYGALLNQGCPTPESEKPYADVDVSPPSHVIEYTERLVMVDMEDVTMHGWVCSCGEKSSTRYQDPSYARNSAGRHLERVGA
jgi:hypothetical protein